MRDYVHQEEQKISNNGVLLVRLGLEEDGIALFGINRCLESFKSFVWLAPIVFKYELADCINKASNIHNVFDAKLRVAREPTSADKVDDLHNIFQEMLVDWGTYMIDVCHL